MRSMARVGFTLVELLVAMAIAALLLGLVASLLGSARAASSAEESATEPRRVLALASELLSEEIGLAGHRPWRVVEAGAVDAVTVSAGPAGHAIRVRFIDDRLAGPAMERDVTFEADLDSSGEPQLYRSGSGSVRQPLVGGVTSLHVESIVTSAGETVAPVAGQAHLQSRGLVVRLATEVGEERTVVIRLPARPTVQVSE